MNIAPAARANLEKLMRLACAESDALRSDLVDVETALASAKASLEKLVEDARHGGGAGERIRARRHGLLVTIETLERAAEDAREKLAVASAETNKLEALIMLGTRAHGRQGAQNAPAEAKSAARTA